jgi:predicted HicB family RNase H-like nuclease
MPKQKPKKVGRPILPKGHAKGSIVRVRFTAEDLKRINVAAKSTKQSLSEWIRSAVSAAIPQ